MSTAPVYEIDPAGFWKDPYPDLARMQAMAPAVHVPQLQATLITRRDDIFLLEKNIEVFSSQQPDGLMTQMMGQNMMRKDGAAHMAERRAIFPTVSPRTVQQHWLQGFRRAALDILDGLEPCCACDLVQDYAMPVSGHALRAVTGLTSLSAADMDRVSQAMIDGCANYAGDPDVTARCHRATAEIDACISAQLANAPDPEDLSLLAVQRRAGLSETQLRANIKLAISGGQNEPRDAIAGTAWALLGHPDQLAAIQAGQATWMQAFEEYARWMSPIGMSPREVAQTYTHDGIRFDIGDRVFLMFGAGNRDPRRFARPDQFDLHQDASAAISFGAGPHFCAGAWISRALIAEVALPLLFQRLPNLRLAGDVPLGGWAFRGPLRVPVVWGEKSRRG